MAESGPILSALDDVEARLADWAREAAEAQLPAAAIRAGAAPIMEERAALEAQLAQVKPRTFAWDEYELGARLWLDAAIDRIVIHPARRPQFDPERVEIIWR